MMPSKQWYGHGSESYNRFPSPSDTNHNDDTVDESDANLDAFARGVAVGLVFSVLVMILVTIYRGSR